MSAICGFKAEPLADRKEAALIALSSKQLDVSAEKICVNMLLLELHTVKVTCGKLNSRHSGLLKPDCLEKSQGRRASGESGSSSEVKVDVAAALGLQVKHPSKKPKSVESLDVFSESAAGKVLCQQHGRSCLNPCCWRGEDLEGLEENNGEE